MNYSGERNVPGAPGNLMTQNMGGIPQRELDPMYLEKLRQQMQKPGTPPPPGFRDQYMPQQNQQPLQAGNPFPMLPQAFGYGNGVYGSMTPMGNAGFFAGPQLGQAVPPGFQNKIVS
jgi:hypothetical protein